MNRHIQIDTMSTTDYFLKDTFLYKLGNICVLTSEYRQKIIWDAHYSNTARHFGVAKTLVILQKYFYWPSLKYGINKYIQSCVVCVIDKLSNR